MSRLDKGDFMVMAIEEKVAMVLFPLSWVVFLVGQSITSGAISLVHLAVGGLCCMLVLGRRRWGRWFCVLYTLLLVLSMCFQGQHILEWPVEDILSCLFFSGAILALLLVEILSSLRRGRLERLDQAEAVDISFQGPKGL